MKYFLRVIASLLLVLLTSIGCAELWNKGHGVAAVTIFATALLVMSILDF